MFHSHYLAQDLGLSRINHGETNQTEMRLISSEPSSNSGQYCTKVPTNRVLSDPSRRTPEDVICGRTVPQSL